MPSTGQNKPAILFTAFEPSGDALAAPIIDVGVGCDVGVAMVLF